nr:hypothetical protein [Tanacetum cinerariifolium]
KYEEISDHGSDKLVDNGAETLGSNKECLDEGFMEINKEKEESVNVNKDKESVAEKSEMNANDKIEAEMRNLQEKPVKTYANVIRKSEMVDNNKLKTIPTDTNELGEEVVVFDEELVKIGSKNWEPTLCGQVVGHNMNLPMLHYHLRMWSRYGYKEIVDNGNGNWLFKFTRMNGMMEVVDKSPWMVNNKPLIVQKWNPSLGLEKVEPVVWIKLFNMPMKAWNNDGISAIASGIGKPKIMDSMTSYVCKSKMGRTEYARVLVEIEAKKGFKNEVVIQYRDKEKNVKGTKKTRTEEEIQEAIVDENKKKDEEVFSLQKNLGGMKAAEEDKGETSYDKSKNFEEEFPRLIIRRIRAWAADREKENNDMLDRMEGIVEDVLDDESAAVRNITVSNIRCCDSGCRIVVGWNSDVIRLMVLNESKQHMLCLIESVHDNRKLYCSFVYASNSRIERRILWDELQIAKACTIGRPWILMGDFNVTLSLSEDTAGAISDIRSVNLPVQSWKRGMSLKVFTKTDVYWNHWYDHQSSYCDGRVPKKLCRYEKTELDAVGNLYRNCSLIVAYWLVYNTEYEDSPVSEGPRFSESVIEFKDIKGVDDFSIGLNVKLAVRIILETITISDAIRACKVTITRDNIATWDKTLMAFEEVGMKVGFLRARISKLMGLSFKSNELLEANKIEQTKAEEEMRVIKEKLCGVQEMIKNLDVEMETLKLKGQKLKQVFHKEANAACDELTSLTLGVPNPIRVESVWEKAMVAPYCASKWAVEGLTKSVAKEVPSGMAIVALNPGVINNDMLASCFGSTSKSREPPPT